MDFKTTTMVPQPEVLLDLYERLGWQAYLKLSAEQLFQAMEQSWYSLYVYAGDVLVAMGRVISDGVINGYICGLGVDARFRGQGLGTELFKKLTDYCVQHGLHVQLFCEPPLVPYYERAGYTSFAIGMRVKE
ncbi:GNAT family N-acetyltransferase [Fusibacter sp. JL298sf-3]